MAALLDCTARMGAGAEAVRVDVRQPRRQVQRARPGAADAAATGTGGGRQERPRARARTSRVPVSRPKSLLGLPWRYALGCMDDLGLILRRDIIWSKPNGLPESVTDRVPALARVRVPPHQAAPLLTRPWTRSGSRTSPAERAAAATRRPMPAARPTRDGVLARARCAMRRWPEPARQAARLGLGDPAQPLTVPASARHRPLRRVPHGAAAPHHPRLVTVRHLHRLRRGTAAGRGRARPRAASARRQNRSSMSSGHCAPSGGTGRKAWTVHHMRLRRDHHRLRLRLP